eukprot:CAMPEP_0170590610 /NCGR_PEP_ID=MMETSP0224-20130122/11960_1 /TAXON_ID=285029 /ORGANISM="Togula jolla, Strain CCCM 725" /LENGTH=288 /DNA_ID=CAMNT_0010914415 /DNA_START=69 /DNA_END=932 /DNA_ORIENTATION=+
MRFSPLFLPLVWVTGALSLKSGKLLASRPKGEIQGEPLDKRMYFLDYMPQFNFIPCACAKCGTTAMLNFIYSRAMGHDWPYSVSADHKDIHNIFAEWWTHVEEPQFELVWDKDRQAELMDSAFSLAVIRDPMERLISAFKSKIQCAVGPHRGDPGREAFVKQLRELQGLETDETCLELTDFLEALASIHANGDAQYLNDHFLPQNLACFYTYPPDRWTVVSTVAESDFFSVLASALDSTNTTPPGQHSSGTKILVTETDYALLQNITTDEYAMIGDYLLPSWVSPNTW